MRGKVAASLFVAVLAVLLGCEQRRPARSQSTSGPSATARAADVSAALPGSYTGPKPWLTGAEKGLKPTLSVANFATDSNDGLPWGSLFSQILYQKINYAPHELFSMPVQSMVLDEHQYMHKGARRTTPFSAARSRQFTTTKRTRCLTATAPPRVQRA